MRAFGLRQIGTELFGFAYSILIARILTPYDFGVFSVCGAALALLSLAGNAGLAAPIIRSTDAPSLRLQRTLFTVYFVLAVLIFSVIWVLAPVLPEFYTELKPSHAWLIRLMAAGMVVHSIGGVSYALLERDLRFGEIAKVEFAQAVAFNVAALALASFGLGVWALAGAAVVRYLVGAIGLVWFRPWSMACAFDWAELSKVLPVSLAIQSSAVLGCAREQIFPVVVGSICGPTALGYLTWARSSAAKPLEVSYVFDRVALPWYAKTSRETGDLKSVVSMCIGMMASVLYPVAAMMLAMAHPAILYVYGPKWLPAVPAFNILALTLFVAPFRGPLQNAIDSQAGATILYRCAMVGLIAQWTVGIGGTLAWGYTGAALAVPAFHAATSAYCLFQTRKDLGIDPVRPIIRPTLHALLGGIAAQFLYRSLATSFTGFCIATGLSALVFLALAPCIQPRAFAKWVRFASGSVSRHWLVKRTAEST